MIKDVVINPLHKIGENERGYTYSFDDFRQGEFLMGLRHQGSISGKHFHEGKSSQKNPEVMILFKGEVKLYVKDLKSGEEATETCTAPCSVTIPPYVWHELKALTDIGFFEMNTLEQHQQDTLYDQQGIQFNE